MKPLTPFPSLTLQARSQSLLAPRPSPLAYFSPTFTPLIAFRYIPAARAGAPRIGGMR